MTQSLTETQQALIAAALQPGEILRWSGGEPSTHFRRRRVLSLGLHSLLLAAAGGAAILLGLPLNQAGAMRLLAGALLALLALAGAAWLLREVSQWKRDCPAVFAVTDQRALVITPRRRIQPHSYPPEALAGMQVRRKPDGSGDILFEGGLRWSSDQAGRTTWQLQPIGFIGLPAVDEVYLLLQQLAAPGRVLVRR